MQTQKSRPGCVSRFEQMGAGGSQNGLGKGELLTVWNAARSGGSCSAAETEHNHNSPCTSRLLRP